MPIRFYSKSPEYAWLSNFSEDRFTLDGVRWASVEHYYQAQKYAGTEAAERIRKADSPLKARKAGQDRSLVPRPDWDAVKEAVMRQAVRAKFEQNRRLSERLLATGDEELVHESSTDLYWGRTGDGTGDNRLGIILMELRAALRTANDA
jgi:N-glycosidase YbiA